MDANVPEALRCTAKQERQGFGGLRTYDLCSTPRIFFGQRAGYVLLNGLRVLHSSRTGGGGGCCINGWCIDYIRETPLILPVLLGQPHIKDATRTTCFCAVQESFRLPGIFHLEGRTHHSDEAKCLAQPNMPTCTVSAFGIMSPDNCGDSSTTNTCTTFIISSFEAGSVLQHRTVLRYALQTSTVAPPKPCCGAGRLELPHYFWVRAQDYTDWWKCFGRSPTKLAAVPHSTVVDVTKLREDLLLKPERERSEEVAGLRSKQKQVDYIRGPFGNISHHRLPRSLGGTCTVCCSLMCMHALAKTTAIRRTYQCVGETP